jgi:hypothetical protein
MVQQKCIRPKSQARASKYDLVYARILDHTSVIAVGRSPTAAIKL